MANISQMVLVWSGSGVVGPAVSVLYCDPGDEHAAMTALRTFFDAIKTGFPTTVTISFPSAGNIFDEFSGDLVSAWADGASPASVTGTSVNTWVNGVGARVKWTTGVIHNGHRVTGATYLVPLNTAAYEGAGNLVAGYITTFQTAANTMAASGKLKVWSRPGSGGPGLGIPVNAAEVPDKVSWLRGRRT